MPSSGLLHTAVNTAVTLSLNMEMSCTRDAVLQCGRHLKILAVVIDSNGLILIKAEYTHWQSAQHAAHVGRVSPFGTASGSSPAPPLVLVLLNMYPRGLKSC